MSSEEVKQLPSVKWVDGKRFIGRSESGHAVAIDVSEERGGTGSAPSPMELILLGVGGCASLGILSILKKSRQQVTDCEVKLSSERADDSPSVFTKIHLHFIVSGKSLSEAQVERAVGLSAEKYCSAAIMIGRSGTEVSFSSEITEA